MEIELSSGSKGHLFKVDSNERGLVIIPDIMGLRQLFVDMAKDLSEKWNANVCTFDVFAGHEFKEAEYEESLKDHVAVVPSLQDSRLFADVSDAADQTGANTIGLTGFCMGGMFTLKSMAGASDKFAKGAAFYPQIVIPDEWKGPELGEPLDIITAESAKNTMAILGDIDPYTPPDLIEKLKATGVTCSIFEECDHGFVHDPHRPAHKKDEAAEAWKQAETFLYGS